MRDPYEILGVPKSADDADIKKAFRALAKKHHPDKHAGDAAAQKKFQEISAAYDILGDKDKRAQFDAGAIGNDGNAKGFDPRGGFRQGSPFGFGSGGGSGAGGGSREFHFDSGDAGGAGSTFEDIFASMMGSGRNRGRTTAAAGQDFTAAVTVSLGEAVSGGSRRVVLANGEQIDVKIPTGVKDGQTIRVKGRGGAGRGGPNGDVLLQVAVAPHPFIVRDGNDLRMDLPVTLKEAVAGGKVPVPTLSGTLAVSIPEGSNTGNTLRLKGKGVPAHGREEAGDLYVRLVISLPDKADPALKAFVENWESSYDPRSKLR